MNNLGVVIMENTNELPKGHIYLQWSYALLVNIPLLVYGVECGWTSPIAKYIQSDASPTGYPVSDEALGWIASSMSLAAIFGVPISSYLADTYGRKAAMIYSLAVPQAISWIIRASYSSVTTLIIARVFSGLASGGGFNIVPMYIKEISQDDIRGILGTLPSLFQTLGVFFVYLIGAYLDYFTVIYIMLCLPIIAFLIILKSPESPAFLVKQDKYEEAIATVALLRGLKKDDKIVQNVMDDMKKEAAYFKSLPDVTFRSILRQKCWRKGFLIMLVTFTLMEMNGAFTIVTYASTILSSTDIEFDVSPEVQSLSFPIVMIIGSIIVAIFIERVGRKPLLVLSFLITALSMFSMATIILIQMQGAHIPAWLPVFVMMISVAMYSGGVLPLSVVTLTEMFSFQIRAKIMGIVNTYSWFLAFWLITIYPPMSKNLGKYSPFILYGLINITGAIFVLIWTPETKGKSEIEIAKLLGKDNKTQTEGRPPNEP